MMADATSEAPAGATSGGRGAVTHAWDRFADRHIGPSADEVQTMLSFVGVSGMGELISQTLPDGIRLSEPLALGAGITERELLSEMTELASRNRVCRSFIGMGYAGTVTPPVIQRNILENPGWYTQYTPYQAEIAQGRLEALLNFQTMVSDLTGLPLAGASLLDEGTAAAEAMAMCFAIARGDRSRFVVAADCHPQTIEVMRTRAEPLGIDVLVADPETIEVDETVAGVLLQYPATDGVIRHPKAVIERAHAAGALVVMAADLLSLTLLTPPGELGADIAVGSAQRFGVPMGFGGPHAAFIATHEKHARKMPGRIIGVSKDSAGRPAYRMAIQTREQHIKRDRATSNICTAQALLAIIAGMYAVYHGPEGLAGIARRVRAHTEALSLGLQKLGHRVRGGHWFDTLRVEPGEAAVGGAEGVIRAAAVRGINLRDYGDGTVGVALDELVSAVDLTALLEAFNHGQEPGFDVEELLSAGPSELPEWAERSSGYLTHPVFNSYRSETELLRYIFELQERDLSLAHSMIALGSCTMKLNATAEMMPLSLEGFARLHPFAPHEQALGYFEMFARLEKQLEVITGFHRVSLQPNAGAQGEYAGLLVIRARHLDKGETDRRVCLIPTSAHGTNPASAVMAGFEVVPVACDDKGNIDVADLRAKAEQHAGRLGALMVTYPSTHGVFEAGIREACAIVHEHGGLVYMDGANMNAQVGLTSPAACGADVCHLNLHKTFCIPHGGGGPGMGPIGVTEELSAYLPGHPVVRPDTAGERAIGPISAAPYGSPSILTISYAYIRMMGGTGLTRATEAAILNANYMAERLKDHYPVLFRGEGGRVAHEFIIDCRPFAKGGEMDAGITIDDIAKRLIDYGFHAPTMSWPVAGTLMIEPTESESLAELDRFCDAMISIRGEIDRVRTGEWDAVVNPLKMAPHTADAVTSDEWDRGYPRQVAAFPTEWTRKRKFWPAVGRVDNAFGDRNLVCSCPPMSEFTANG
ncbi:MAG: aminomethyl-transferring glycine dehydrogenase [Planctomycetota bacterium]